MASLTQDCRTHLDRPVLSVMTSARSIFCVVSANASFRFCQVQFHGRLCTTTCAQLPPVKRDRVQWVQLF